MSSTQLGTPNATTPIMISSPDDKPFGVSNQGVIIGILQDIINNVEKKSDVRDLRAIDSGVKAMYTTEDQINRVLENIGILLGNMVINQSTYKDYFNLYANTNNTVVNEYLSLTSKLSAWVEMLTVEKGKILSLKESKKSKGSKESKESTTKTPNNKEHTWTEEERAWMKDVKRNLQILQRDLIEKKVKYNTWLNAERSQYEIDVFLGDMISLLAISNTTYNLIKSRESTFTNKSMSNEMAKIITMKTTADELYKLFTRDGGFWTGHGEEYVDDLRMDGIEDEEIRKSVRKEIQGYIKLFTSLQNIEDFNLGLKGFDNTIDLTGIAMTSTGFKVWDPIEVSTWFDAHKHAYVLHETITDMHEKMELRFAQNKIISGTNTTNVVNHYGFFKIMLEKTRFICDQYINKVTTAMTMSHTSIEILNSYINYATDFLGEYSKQVDNVFMIVDIFDTPQASDFTNSDRLDLGAKLIRDLLLYRKHCKTEFANEDILPLVISKCINQILRLVDVTRMPFYRAVLYGFYIMETLMSDLREKIRGKRIYTMFDKICDVCFQNNIIEKANPIPPVEEPIRTREVKRLNSERVSLREDLDPLRNPDLYNDVNNIIDDPVIGEVEIDKIDEFDIAPGVIWNALFDTILTMHTDGSDLGIEESNIILRDVNRSKPLFKNYMKDKLHIKSGALDEFLEKVYESIYRAYDILYRIEFADNAYDGTIRAPAIPRIQHGTFLDTSNFETLFPMPVITLAPTTIPEIVRAVYNRNFDRDDIFKETYDEFYIFDKILLVPTAYSQCFVSDIIGSGFFFGNEKLYNKFILRSREHFNTSRQNYDVMTRNTFIFSVVKFISEHDCFGRGYIKLMVYFLHKWLDKTTVDRKDLFKNIMVKAYENVNIVQPEPLTNYSVYKVLRLLGYQQQEGNIIVSVDTVKLPLVSHVPVSIEKYNKTNPLLASSRIPERKQNNPEFDSLHSAVKGILNSNILKQNRVTQRILNLDAAGYMADVNVKVRDLIVIMNGLDGNEPDDIVLKERFDNEDDERRLTDGMDNMKLHYKKIISIINEDRIRRADVQRFLDRGGDQATHAQYIGNINSANNIERRLRRLFTIYQNRYKVIRAQTAGIRYIVTKAYDYFSRYTNMKIDD